MKSERFTGFRMLLPVAAVAMLTAGCVHMPVYGPGRMSVTKYGSTHSQIVVAEDASPSTRYAGEELQRFLHEMTGVEIPLVTDSAPVAKREIVVGSNAHLYAIDAIIDTKALGHEGYIIRSVKGAKRSGKGPHLVIVGGEPRGTLYGVYGLLEDHLKCRWFTPEVSRIPKRANLTIRPIRQKVIPELEYREPFVMDCFDGDWCARNRVNSSAASLEERHGGKVTYFGFVHTFDQLVPPDKYFDAHPEYFSEIKGQRIKEHTQLCCTNPDVVRIVTEEIRRRMREHPEAMVFSVSQNDWGNYCQCAKCQALAKAEDSQIAPVLQLVNQVAGAVRDEFPNQVIDTLAYQWTRKPPKTMRPAPNVIVRLCSIECCFSHSFRKCDSPANRAFVKDVEGWSAMCSRLWVWDYVTSFSNYFVPFPNLRVRAPNIRFFVNHNVRGIFEQDVYTTRHGELSSLSGYVGAKLLWNPRCDAEHAINEFLEGVYGNAAKPIRQYLELIHNKVENDNIHVNIWVGADAPYLDGDILPRADALWDAAEAAVAGDSETLERVRVARLSVDYAIIERARTMGSGAYVMDQERFTIAMDPKLRARMQRFLEVAERNGVTAYRESNGALASYRQELDAILKEQSLTPLPAVEAGATSPGLAYRYYEGGWEALPDFDALTPVQSGVTSAVSLEPAVKKDAFGLVFTGFIRAPRDGVYAFSTTSNDGSKLFIDDTEVVNNDGLHGTRTLAGFVGLRAGLHAIRITYFDAGGMQALEAHWAGPAIDRQPIPPEVLQHAR